MTSKSDEKEKGMREIERERERESLTEGDVGESSLVADWNQRQ